MDLILVRHGRTVDNLSKIYSRDWTPLDPISKLELVSTRSKLHEFEYEDIYVSELDRCRETLDMLIEGEKTYTIDSRINEFNYGDFKGHSYIEVNKKYPYIYEELEINTFTTKIPDGESYEELFQRVNEFLIDLKKKDRNALIVSHDGVIRTILSFIYGRENFFKFSIENAKISVVSINGNYSVIKKINY